LTGRRGTGRALSRSKAPDRAQMRFAEELILRLHGAHVQAVRLLMDHVIDCICESGPGVLALLTIPARAKWEARCGFVTRVFKRAADRRGSVCFYDLLNALTPEAAALVAGLDEDLVDDMISAGTRPGFSSWRPRRS